MNYIAYMATILIAFLVTFLIMVYLLCQMFHGNYGSNRKDLKKYVKFHNKISNYKVYFKPSFVMSKLFGLYYNVIEIHRNRAESMENKFKRFLNKKNMIFN